MVIISDNSSILHILGVVIISDNSSILHILGVVTIRDNSIHLMTLDEVNTPIYQPQRSDYHRLHDYTLQCSKVMLTSRALWSGDNHILKWRVM